MYKFITKKIKRKEVEEIVCNRCGKRIHMTAHGPEEDVLHVEQHWGYFSKKDGECHKFDLCEECYDEIVKEFRVPVERREEVY